MSGLGTPGQRTALLVVTGFLAGALTSRILRLVGSLSDVNAELAHQAAHDELTGVRNRQAMRRMVDDAGSCRLRGVVHLDLDGFKPVSDRFGHDAGDAVLVEVAARLTALVRGEDRVMRMGGDEFVVLVTESDTDFDALIDRLHRRVNDDAFHWQGTELPIGVSVGYALAAVDEDGRPVGGCATLLADADAEMLRSKAVRTADRRHEPVAVGG